MIQIPTHEKFEFRPVFMSDLNFGLNLQSLLISQKGGEGGCEFRMFNRFLG